jgi:hypothetical protein
MSQRAAVALVLQRSRFVVLFFLAAEHWVRSVREECDRLIIRNVRHFRRVL